MNLIERISYEITNAKNEDACSAIADSWSFYLSTIINYLNVVIKTTGKCFRITISPTFEIYIFPFNHIKIYYNNEIGLFKQDIEIFESLLKEEPFRNNWK